MTGTRLRYNLKGYKAFFSFNTLTLDISQLPIYLLKPNNGRIMAKCKISSKLTINTTERRQGHTYLNKPAAKSCSSFSMCMIFVRNIVLVFLLSIFNK